MVERPRQEPSSTTVGTGATKRAIYGLRHDSNPTKLGLMDCAGLADAYLIGMSEGPNFDAAMERRFQEYVEDLGAVVGNDARRRGLSDYMTGLLLPGERKSMEPIAERLESRAGTRRSSISSAKPVGRTAPCASGCSVGSCR